MENQRKELNDSRVEISNLKMHIKGFGSRDNLAINDVDNVLPDSLNKYKEEIKKLQMEIERLKEKNRGTPEHGNLGSSENEPTQTEDKVIEMNEDQGATLDVVHDEDAHSPALQTLNEFADKHTDSQLELFNPAHTNTVSENIGHVSQQNARKQGGDMRLHVKTEGINDKAISEKTASPFYLIKISYTISFCLVLTLLNLTNAEVLKVMLANQNKK